MQSIVKFFKNAVPARMNETNSPPETECNDETTTVTDPERDGELKILAETIYGETTSRYVLSLGIRSQLVYCDYVIQYVVI